MPIAGSGLGMGGLAVGRVVSVAWSVSLVHCHVALAKGAGGHENRMEMRFPSQEHAELESRSIGHTLGAEESFRGVNEKGGWKKREEYLSSGQRRPLMEAGPTAEPHAPTQDVCSFCGFPCVP